MQPIGQLPRAAPVRRDHILGILTYSVRDHPKVPDHVSIATRECEIVGFDRLDDDGAQVRDRRHIIDAHSAKAAGIGEALSDHVRLPPPAGPLSGTDRAASRC